LKSKVKQRGVAGTHLLAVSLDMIPKLQFLVWKTFDAADISWDRYQQCRVAANPEAESSDLLRRFLLKKTWQFFSEGFKNRKAREEVPIKM